MKNALFITSVCLMAATVGMAGFWFGSSQGSDSRLPEMRWIEGTGHPALSSQTLRSSSSALATGSPSVAPTAADSAAPSPALLATSVPHRGSGPASATGGYGDSASTLKPDDTSDAPHIIENTAQTASALSLSSSPAAKRIVGPRGVTVPLAFKNIDLFIHTPAGLRYAPVHFDASSNPESKSNVPPKPGDPGTLIVDEATATALESMRQDFTQAVGGLGQDGTDPQYRKRWETEQSLSDQRFRARFGTQAFLSYQAAAAHKAEAEKQAGTTKTK